MKVYLEQSFDAWGKRRNPTNWNNDVVGLSPTNFFHRGYTGHEHIDEFKIINMNGRLYDPVLGRMFSPDNYVQNSGFTQNFNRYSYAYNNPLKYTDPDGEIIVPILIGAAIGVLTNGIGNSVNNDPFFLGAGKAAFIGGIGGALSFGIGQAALGMSGIGKVAFQTVAHGHLGGAISTANGGTYGQGFLSGAAGSLIGSGANSLLKNTGVAIQAVGTVSSGALAGGIGAEIAGGDFWDGARNGAISAGLNHAYHSMLHPKIFLDNFDETLNFDEYSNSLEKHLEANGFNSRLDVLESSSLDNLWAWAKGNPTAHVSLRDFYSSGAPLDAKVLGYAKPGSNSTVVYGKGTYFGKSYNPTTIDLVNVTTHELGHGIFSFSHSNTGVMRSAYRTGSSLIHFNNSQRAIISNSVWGRGY